MKMYLKIISAALCLLIFGFDTALSQNKPAIMGKVLDSATREPIGYASAVLFSLPDSAMVTGAVTDSTGTFKFPNAKPGAYLVKISFVGYKTISKVLDVRSVPFSINEPVLMDASLVLNEVVVSGTQNERQITAEKTKVNVSQSMAQVSGNLTDILRSQAGVNMDADGNIYLRGNKNILVLMDGVPTTVAALNTFPSSNVDNIEIITNPDVRYDAEGTGGIINIITKRKPGEQGVSGRVALNYGIDDKINGGLNLQMRKGIWGIDLGYNGKYERNDINSGLTRDIHTTGTALDQQIDARQTNRVHNIQLLVTASPSPKDMVALNLKTMFPKIHNEQSIEGTQTRDGETTFFNRFNDITFDRKLIEGSISYTRAFEKKRHELSMSAAFSRTKGDRPCEYYIGDLLSQKSFGGGAPTNATVQADYLKSVSKTGKIETGLKGFKRWNNFEYNFYDFDQSTGQWVANQAFCNDLEHHEYIASAYLMYSDRLAKSLTFKVGARLEYSSSRLLQKSIGDKVSKHFWHPFPYLMMQYDIDAVQRLTLTLNRRITRPTYPQLNPIISVVDHTLYETGNKDLNPEVADKLELNYSLTRQALQLRSGVFFSTTKDYITQVTMLAADDNLKLTYANGRRDNKVGANLDVTYQPCRFLSLNPAFSVFHSHTTGSFDQVDLKTDGMAWTASLKATVKPEKFTELQMFFNYNSPMSLPQFELERIYYLDISAKRSFMNKRLTASLTLTDVFNTNKWNISSDNAIYNLHNNSKGQTRVLWIGMTYSINAFKPNSRMQQKKAEQDNSRIRIGGE